ncbi:tetratricopeptide (TPR) repeat protein [Nocardioides aromaticivorans]|uniref:Tetratricopeptide (TPR) repeat protein n=1 Tax=Nocardioides aromaticivorans TaxID=200618 RepID=A0A7Z0CPN6_9ACTN|nr:hypothetical protein [Nocardioides aromaticivorans]NYI46498.1 tetratricopeptide (TPR) repeat protein [Nocardioides aromaticivorans]
MSAAASPGDLERLALERYVAGDLDGCVAAWEGVYDAELAAGRPDAAARAAALVALNLLCETGLMAPVRGWVARARRLVADAEPGPVHALLAITTTYERFLSGDPDAAWEPAREAVELGERFGVDPARGLGRVALGRLAIHTGDVDAGIALLDELAMDLGAGRFDPLTTGNVYCELICAAQWLGRHDRAREWTEVMDRWRQGPAFGATHGRCRVHRAELLRISGPADAAEDEALAACAELRPWLRRELGWPLVELGNIRLRRGDLAGAEEAFREAHARAWSPQPGMALARLARGDLTGAAAMVRAEIEHPMAVPWKERPPFGELRLVPLLAAEAEIACHRGDAATAVAAADQLTTVLAHYPSAGIRAEAALARARAALLTGDPATAVDTAQEAVAEWAELEAPYDAAVARTVLGHAHRAAGNDDLARLEWQAASTGFVAFGAAGRVAEVAALLEAPAASPVPGARATLAHEGDRWRLGYSGVDAWLPDLKGVQLLATLLAAPGREFPAVDLAGAAVVEAGLPVLDEEARASYRRRLGEVEDDLAEAERDNDEARRELASRDREYLLAELSGAVGLGGRSRTTGGTAERARTSVTRSLRYALARVAEAHPDLGAHLSRAVRTGTCCSYVPDPTAPLDWHVTP